MGLSALYAQNDSSLGNNYISISPQDDMETIVSKAAHVTPSERQLRWQKLELTAFLHFGINTFTNREWGTGKEDPSLFNPTQLDAEQWVKTLKEAGFKLVILTAKHHDGFCLWPSAYTNHSVEQSPWKNGQGDVVKLVAKACKKYNIGFGVYLSPWDMNYPYYGNTEKYNQFFMNQLRELLTNYGQVDEVWFDGANGTGANGKVPDYHFDKWYQLIRELQPQATIAIMGPDVRWVGTETGYGRKSEWSVVPVDAQLQENIAAHSQQDLTFKPTGDMTNTDLGSHQKIKDAKALIWYPAEADVSIRPGWFYHPEQDDQVKTPEKLLDIYYGSVGRNTVLLVNIPPNKKGLISQPDIDALQSWRKTLDATFKENLAKKARVKTSTKLKRKDLFDHNLKTYWTTEDQQTSGFIVFDLKDKKTFDVLWLQENIRLGQRIEAFKLEYWDGQKWIKVTEGTTVGYKRLLRFDPITAPKVKLTITSSRLNPTIAEFGLYNRPHN